MSSLAERELKILKANVCSLLYELGRDYLPLGDLEILIRNSQHGLETKFTNKQLAKYTKKAVKRLAFI